ncbi:MAG: HAD hydrolase family protein [Brevinema sp.]
MKKFLACDVDGTLLASEEHLTNRDCQAIKQFRQAGNHFALCTGRTLNWVNPLFAEAPLEADSLILANGATLYHINSLSPLQTTKLTANSLPASIGKEIISYLYNHEDVNLYWGDGDITYELDDRRITYDVGSFAVGSEFTKYISYQEFMDNPTDIIGFGASPISKSVSDARGIRDRLQERWGQQVTIVSNLFFVDVMMKDISKGNGIKQMLSIINEPFSVYGIGDSFNDESMFHFVGKDHAFLMEEGDQELRYCTHRQVSSVAECINLLMSDSSYA